MTKEEYKDLQVLARDFGFADEFRPYTQVRIYTYDAIQQEILHNADKFINFEKERKKIIAQCNDKMLCAYKILKLKRKWDFNYDYV